MGWSSIILKEFREHTLALFSLAIGLIAVVLLSLSQQRAGEFNMSGFEVVRFALITVIPLVTLIVGNRLIVREYTGGTRRFVESLPIRPATPLIIKYVLGWLYLSLLGLALVIIAAALADASEFIDARYLTLLIVKTTAIITVYWSVVFFASFTGKIRLVIYLLIGAALMYLINLPGFDETRLAPVALMDHQLFVFERDVFPWRDLIETGLVSFIFVISGFALALFNEGSVAEQLGKPLSTRNVAAIVLLVIGVFSVYASLQEKWATSTQEFSGDFVLRSDEPPIEISYLSEEHKTQAQTALNNITIMLNSFQADAGITSLPRLQIALNQNLEATEVYPEYSEGVLVTANFSEYSYYEHSMMNTIGLHHMLLMLTNGRWDYETRHWLLDGYAWWWAEGAELAPESPNNAEHYTRAILATRRFTPNTYALQHWQITMDLYGFEAAGALAYTALLYLAETHGTDLVIDLATDYLQENPASSSLESLNRIANPDVQRFEKVTGIKYETFTTAWLQWLQSKASDPVVASLLKTIPQVTGEVVSTIDSNGVHWLEGRYKPMKDYQPGFTGTCVLRHQRTSSFELETEIYERERDRQPCITEGNAHRVQTTYASGDRTYTVLEFESDLFDRPIPLWSGRIHVK